ncbi:MAG: AAA family ATPase [Parvularcula sp.]
MGNPVPDSFAQDPDLKDFDQLAQKFQDVQTALGEVVFGQNRVISEVLTTLLAGGHNLLVGAPGLAKTRLVSALGTVLSLETNRVQFTPDLMPTDILGTEILEETSDGKRAFRFISGPVFTQLLMADEINRASPRTQSALLEAMQEHQVTVAGERRPLPTPFHVLATQNPIEQEGTYPLPEAQLDRFLLQTVVDYPDAEAEKRILLEATTAPQETLAPVASRSDLLAAQEMVRTMPMGEDLVAFILALVRSLRPGGEAAAHLFWGAGPRASQALSLASRARAFLDGRSAPTSEDVIALAPATLRHRIALNFTARADGVTPEGLIDDMIQAHA